MTHVHIMARGICHGKCCGNSRWCSLVLAFFPQHMKHDSCQNCSPRFLRHFFMTESMGGKSKFANLFTLRKFCYEVCRCQGCPGCFFFLRGYLISSTLALHVPISRLSGEDGELYIRSLHLQSEQQIPLVPKVLQKKSKTISAM